MTKVTSPVLLDRLAKTLDRQGVKMKRSQLLESTACAFGHRSSNAFSAAVASGEIDPPHVVPIGRIELKNGESLYLVRDPLANSPYALDEAFVDQVVSDDKAEWIGVSPYGHLLRMDGLADATMETISSTQEGSDAAATSLGDDAARLVIESLVGHLDQEIENRQHGIDPAAWTKLKEASDVAHALLRNSKALTPITKTDATSIRIGRDDLENLLEAARSHADDITSGIEDGMYDAEENPGIDDLESSIETVELRLAMPVAPVTKPLQPIAPPEGHVSVHVAHVSHRHGINVYASDSRAGLDAQIAEYCRGSWSQIRHADTIPDSHEGMTDDEVSDVYFGYQSEHGEELADYEHPVILIKTTGTSIGSGKTCARCDAPLDGKGLCTDETCEFSEAQQDDPRGWSGHPSPPTTSVQREASADTQIIEALQGKPADWASQIAASLREGVGSDIWYDAHDFDGEGDRESESTIEETQNAMIEAAAILEGLRPSKTADGQVTVALRGASHQRQAAAMDPIEKDTANDYDRVQWITDSEGDLTGSVTATDIAKAGLPFHVDREDSLPLTENEYEWLGAGRVLNADLSHPVKLGYAVLWNGRKWLAPEIEFVFEDKSDDLDDPEGDALRVAERHMEAIRSQVEALGGHLHLFQGATDSAHELSILMPFHLAEQSASIDDWEEALSYLLMTQAEKDARPQVSCEFTAQVDVNRSIMSVDPLGDTTWDATFDALRWGREQARAILLRARDPDHYAYSPLAPKWVRDWTSRSPFAVDPIGLEEAMLDA